MTKPKRIRQILRKWFVDPFTVAHDLSPFAHPLNRREELDHFNGLFWARRFAKSWVRQHPMGQARILNGHLQWGTEIEIK